MNEFQKKQSFVENELAATLKRLNTGIINATYNRAENGYETVTLEHNNGETTEINVTADSHLGILCDVCKHL